MSIFDQLQARHPNVRSELYPTVKGDTKRVYLTGFMVPYNDRGKGLGTDFMEDLIKVADENGFKITLTPSSSYGGNVIRLKQFYKGFGFVENKGDNRDFSHKEDMYRDPQGLNEDSNEIEDDNIVYHGGDKKITKLDPQFIKGGVRANLGWGVYFTSSLYKATTYGKELTYLDISNLNILDLNEKINEELLVKIKELATETKKNSLLTMLGALYDYIHDTFKDNMGKTIWDGWRIFSNKIKWDTDKTWSEMLAKLGYDGMQQGNYEYVIFNFDKANQYLSENSEILNEYIRHRDGKWVVVSKKGKTLGTHDTKEDALSQLRAIEMHKHMEEGDDMLSEEKKKADRCLRIARRKYDKPSAYRSGAIVQCRRGKIWKGLSESDINDAPEDVKELIYKAHDAITRRKGKDYAPDVHELQAWVDDHLEQQNEAHSDAKFQFTKDLADDPDYAEFKKNSIYNDETGQKRTYGTPNAVGRDSFVQKKKWGRVDGDDYDPDFDDEIDEAKKTDFSKEKKSGLHGWFSRRGGGGSKGWVDCNTCRNTDGKKKCKACGRQAGEKRAKYPSCRPTPSACGTPGKGKSWGKTKESYDIMNEVETKEKKRIALLFTVIDNKVLLFKRSPEETTNPGKYGMLGGHIEKGETPEEALRREVKEEAGVELKSYKKLKVYELEDVQLNVFYTNEFDTENIKLDKKEHTGKKFFTLEELDNMSAEECIDTNKGIARDYNKKAKEEKQLNETLERMKSIITF
jgi:8-oxo-dGTP pyrophosphatase MutT (NUDIX family)